LAEAWRKGRVFLDDHPLEECTFPSGYFDLVVLINVLDHVRDAIMCLKQVVRVTKSGGYLVVGQDLSNSEDAERTKGDIGHPIRIGHDTLDEALTPHFLRVFARVLTREEGRNPSAHYGTYILIGKKVAKSGNLDLSAHDV
jgi:ubiquinone/menaquinone biosynthesis C-methylase UbiE